MLTALSPQQIVQAVLNAKIPSDTYTHPSGEISGQALLLDEWLLVEGMLEDEQQVGQLASLKDFANGGKAEINWAEVQKIFHEQMEDSRIASIYMTHGLEKGLKGILEVDPTIEEPRTANTQNEGNRLSTAGHNRYRELRDEFITKFALPAFELAHKKTQAQLGGRGDF